MNPSFASLRASSNREAFLLRVLSATFVAALSLILTFILTARPTHAADCNFMGGGGGATDNNFFNFNNWVGCNGTYPGSGDNVNINSGQMVILNPAAINTTSTPITNVTVSGTLVVASSTLNISGTLTINTSSTNQAAALVAVSSTQGQIFVDTVTSSGKIILSGGNFTVTTTFTNAGVFTVGGGTVTSTGNWTNLGNSTFNMSTGTTAVFGDFTSFTPANITRTSGDVGVFRLAGTANQNITGTTFPNLQISKTAGTASVVTSTTNIDTYLSSSSTGWTLSFGSNALTVSGATWLGGGTVTSTSGTFTFTGPVSSTASIGSSTGNQLFSSTLKNSGTFQVGSGTATSTGSLTNAGGANLKNNSGLLNVLADFTNSGTYSAQSGTFRVASTADQSITGSAFNNFESIKTLGTITFVTSDVTVAGTMNLTTTPTGVSTFNLVANNLTVTATTTIYFSVTLQSTSGNLTFSGAVTSTGTLGTTSGNQSYASTLQNNGAFFIGSGTATTTGTLTNSNSGTITGNTGVLSLTGNFTNTGATTPNTGTFRLAGTAAQSIDGALWNKLVSIKSSGTATVNSSSTFVGTANIAAGGTIALGANSMTIVGLITNLGLFTEGAAGKIVHTLESLGFTTATAFATSTSYSTGDSVYIQVQDSNRNLDGTTADTMTVPVTVNAAGGSDSETLTLTETGAATGIFRSGAISLVNSSAVSTGNNQFEITASGVGTETYTDNKDSADTSSATVTLTYVSASAGSSSSGGGGGGGGLSASGYAVIPIPTPSPAPTPAPAPSAPAPSSDLVMDPSNLTSLLAAFGLTRNLAVEDLVLAQVKADAKEFALTLTSDQAIAIRNFIVYGISNATIKFGQGERRAIERDYMQTVHRPDFVWSDVHRIAAGLIPIKRNLALEQARVGITLPVFKKIFGHNPNFQNVKENLSWNTMLYRIRFTRDLVKENVGIKAYVKIFGTNPRSPFNWSVVRVLGYVL